MEDENKEEPKKPWDFKPKYDVDNARRKLEIYETTLEYFKNNSKVSNFIQQFNPHDLQKQLESYAWRKAEWLITKDFHDYWHDCTLLQTKNKAEECLENIQQKRLFDKQILWRAELFTHPIIETTYDFSYWEHNVLNCPFLDPITSEDVDLYIEFLNEYFGENLAMFAHWQDYDTYCTNRITVIGQMYKQEIEDSEKDEDEENDDYDDDEDNKPEQAGKLMPPWYLFWEEKRGTSNWSVLPDKRKDKEHAYSHLGLDEEQNAAREKLKINPPDNRPFLSLWEKNKLFAFIEACENPAEKNQILKAYETNQKVYYDKEKSDAMELVKYAWEDLDDCIEPFPIAEGITDWKEALIQTAKNWEHLKLIRMIPVVYDEYIFRRETGIAHPYDEKRADYYLKYAAKHKAHILRGRELKGEPRDLNF